MESVDFFPPLENGAVDFWEIDGHGDIERVTQEPPVYVVLDRPVKRHGERPLPEAD